MKTKLLLIVAGFFTLGQVSAQQCYDDECDDNNDIPIPGCCVGNTVGATWSGYADVNCVNMWYEGTAFGNPDIWMSFTAPTTGFIEITIDNITASGPTNYVVFDHQNAEVCASLNSFGLLAGEACNNLPGDGVGGVTATDTIQYAVEAGERYWILLSHDVENGATPGTVNVCIDVVPPPPPPPPAPGQDCVDAQVLCHDSQTGFYNGQLDLGDGNVEENSTNNWSSCLGNETSSQWYTFTASQSGSFEMMLTPDTYSTATQEGDDFDWELYDITASGCTDGATSLACDYSGCDGSTGFGASGAASFSQVAVTNYQNNNPPGPGSCAGGPQWNTTTVNLTAGNTYALIIQNYSGSLGGVTVDFQGTAILGPTSDQALFNAVLDPNGCVANLTTSTAAIPNYTYTWDFGDGNTATGAGNGSHTYANAGTYIVELTIEDALGCMQSSQQIIDVAACTPLPVEMTSFTAEVVIDRVSLRWATASEKDNDYFVVQKSQDLVSWEQTDVVYSNGNSTNGAMYYSIDREPYTGTSYYRLVQVDVDGTKDYISPVTVHLSGDDKIELVKTTNMYGQEVDVYYKGMVINFYSDGSKEIVVQ
ncbi:MAG: PKD domain-containing protein [bacterium]|nr:PKD domain-containing protein [bacterium]